MISVELWRASTHIGAFNSKRCSSRSGSFFSNSSFFHCCTNKDVQSRDDTTWPTAQKRPDSAAVSTVVLSSRVCSSSEPSDKHTATNFSAEHGFLSGISIKQLHSPSHFTRSYSSSFSSSSSSSSSSFSSSSARSHDDVFQYHFPHLGDVLIILLTVIAVISQLLIISGDIETNPGPVRGADNKPGLNDLLHMSYTGKDGKDVHVRLMDQVKPHWRRLAIALDFPEHEIATMESKDDPVYYLLSEWLRGANKEKDPRPVTWGTFITALRDANIQEEATVLESHFIQIPKATSELPNSGAITLFRGFVLIRNLSGGYTMRHGSIEVTIKPDVSRGLMSLVGEYADMLLVLRSTKLRNKSTKKLVTFFSDFSDEQLVRECSTLSKAIDILIEKFKIYIFNIEILTASCKHFDKPQMKTCVQKYKQHLNEFLENTSVKEFMDNFQTKIIDHEIVEFVTLKMDESRIDCSLRALKTLICHFFGVIYKALGHCDTGAGCVCITWLVPSSLVPLLRMKAMQLSQKYLTSQGVLELVIGLRIAPSEQVAEQQVWDQLISKQDEKVTHEAALSANATVIINLSGQNEQLQSRISELEEQLKMRDEKFLAIHDKYELVERVQDTELGVSRKHDVIRELEKVTQWQKLGLIFGVPQQYLDKIYERHKDEPNKCTEMVITRWWDMYPGSTWEEVAVALRKIGENHLADFLIEKYVVLRADSAYGDSESEESDSAAEDQFPSVRGTLDSLQPTQREEPNPKIYWQTTMERSPLPGFSAFSSTQVEETPLPSSITEFGSKEDPHQFEPGFTPKDLNHSDHEYQQTCVGETPDQASLVSDQEFTSGDNLHFEHKFLQTHGETFHPPISSPSYAEVTSRDSFDHFEHEHQQTHGETADQTTSASYQGFIPRENLYRLKHEHQQRNTQLLKADLTVENYKSRFHQLLCREEEEHERILRNKCDGLYTLTMYHHRAEAPGNWRAEENEDERDVRYGYLSADHLDGDKVAYAEQACENDGNLVLSYNGKDYLAKMVLPYSWKKNQDCIYIRMPKVDALKLRNLRSQFVIPDVYVMLELKYSYFDRLHEAVDLLSHCTIQRLIPTGASWFSYPGESPALFLSNRYKEFLALDYGQLKALEMIVYAKPKAPVIVVGSFGTGKTRMLAQAAVQILVAKYNENPRVLICAHHQTSANAFLTKYFGPMKEQRWRVNIARMMFRINEIDERYRKYCRSSSYVAKNLNRIQLVVTTFANCLHLAKLLKGSADRWFTHILIDEGAQTREPETIAPLFMCGPKTVVAIAGDHKQVGPSMLVLGEDPQKYGLGQSLLERLHTLYSTQTHTNAEHHCITLLHNYRCHRSLLALTSYLFYHSTLITNRIATKQALLHPDTTYSLHFICSSLDDTIVEVKDSTNRDEAVLLLEAAAKYVKEWPPEWGNRELKTVCVMATTANQQNLIRKIMRSTSQQLNFVKCLTGHGQDHNSIQTLKAYDMQGREFQCVFLSTAEPTTAEGASKNPTKTPCSQYVFNTALTRAKSLVVCAGNPFLLMKIEKMIKNRDKQPFWVEYIRRCIENETFIVPASLRGSNTDRQDKLSKLRVLVFKSDSQAKLAISSSDRRLDSITMAYKKAFENLPNLQRCRVQLKYAMGGMQWQMKGEEKNDSREIGVQQESLPKGVPQYNLEVVNYRKALAHPLNANKPVVTLNGLGNRKGAFDGDVVAIQLYEPIEQTDKTYGKVTGVIQKCHQERYVCRVDRHSTLHFNPIDGKTPTFVNLPRISRDLIKYRREDIEAGLTSQHQWVVVFEEDSIPLSGEDNLPRIKEIISAESANQLLFVVREIEWDPKYRLPIGAVVESLPLGTNLFHAERLLRAAYSVVQDDLDKSDEEKKEENHENVEASVKLPGPDVVCQAFTIDPSDARNLDDALSLIRESDGTYTMSVHIANVGGQLEENSAIDMRAQSRGNSVYGFFRNMLPAAVCQQFSLSPKRVCDVLTVSTTVTVEKDGTITVADSDPVIKVGKVQSQVQLDYSEAQLILDQDLSKQSGKLRNKLDQYPSIEDQPDLPQSLDLLFKIAMHLRVRRLGRAAYAYDFSEEEVEESWQAHLLVVELMVWANSTVAKYVFQHLPNFAVLRRQESPPGEEVKELFERFAGVLGHSVGLSRLGNIRLTDQPFLIPHSTMLELQRAVETRNTFHLQQLLTSDYLYPQLAAAAACLRAISQRSEYVCSKSIGQLISSNTNVSPFRHHSLCLDYYTHFTSPIRRFCDVVVQRILLSILNNTECSYNVDQLEKLCRHFNIRFRETKQFQKEKIHLEFAKQFGESCEETRVYLHRNRNRFEVSFPELKYKSCLKWQKAEFHISALVCEEHKGGLLKWRAFMFSFNGNNFILDHPKIQLSFDDSEDSMIDITVFYRLDSDGVAIESQDYPKPHLKKASKDQDKLKRYHISSVLTQDVIAIDAEKWQNIIAHVDNLSEDTIKQLSDVLIKLQPVEQSGNKHAILVDRERFKVSPILKYEVKQMLGSNSIVPVWLGQTLLQEPILTPCLQLMEVAPELRICLQHNTHPAECFSDPHFGQASKAAYTSLEEYVRLWEKVFLAEVAEDSVRGCDKSLTILKAVPLHWPKLKIPVNSTDEYFVPEGLVELTIPSEKRDFLEYNIRINIGDLVCVRYDVKEEQCRAVYHLVVEDKYAGDQPSDDIEEENKEKLPLVVKMKYINRSSCQVSPRMADVLSKHQPTCELQVINLQESYNHVYESLMSLKHHSMRRTEGKDLLVHLVARGDIKEINRLRNPSMIKALDVLTKDPMAHTLWSHGVELNTVQKEAIKRALMHRFQLIQGPPGTGKSETGAHIAYIFAQLLEDHQCVMYCAPSNKAVDVVHDKLCEANEKLRRSGRKELKLLRLYGKMHEKMDFPSPYTSHGYLAPAEGESRCEERFRSYALHHLIRKNCSKLKEMEDEFEKMRLENTVPAPQMLKRYKRLIRDREREIIGKQYDVVLGMCNECAGARMKHLKKAGRVAQVIVDECGMAHEPETIAAVSLSEHVVLIGDHKQLQPVVKLTAACENGLSTSLFQRYAESFEEECPLIALEVQYRMHSKICEFPSNHFYSGTLRPDHSVYNRCPVEALKDFWPTGLRYPIVFCDMVGKEEETPGLSEGQKGRKTNAHSKCNTEEAKKAVEVARVLRRRLRDTKITIAILTPYRAQKDLVSDEMSNVSTGDEVDGDPQDRGIAKILTINESQGDEYDYVILTTVRSQPLSEISNPDLVQPDREWLRDSLGFVTDPHQVNMAITRAKQGLIIVGNRTLLEYDNNTWKPLIEFYKRNNCVINGSKFPR